MCACASVCLFTCMGIINMFVFLVCVYGVIDSDHERQQFKLIMFHRQQELI